MILQLRLRGVDILAATEEGTHQLSDHELLETATALGRVMLTQDIRFRVLAENWQREERPFAGLIFAHQRRVSFGEMVEDLELIAKATDTSFWQNHIEQLPLQANDNRTKSPHWSERSPPQETYIFQRIENVDLNSHPCWICHWRFNLTARLA